MPLISKDQFLAKLRELPTQTIHVPELGGDVMIRTISGGERDAWEADCFKNGKLTLDNVRAKFVALTVVDEQGNRWFNDLDVNILGRGNAAALDRIYAAAKKLNGIDKKDEEELVKNSGTAQSGGSGSGSPPTSA